MERICGGGAAEALEGAAEPVVNGRQVVVAGDVIENTEAASPRRAMAALELRVGFGESSAFER